MPGFWIPLLWGLAGHLPKRGCQGFCTEGSPCIKFLFGVARHPISPPQIFMSAIVSLHLLFPPHLWFHSLFLLHLFSTSVPISSRSSTCGVNTCSGLPVTVYPVIQHNYEQSLLAYSELPQFGQLHSYPNLVVSVKKAS